MWNKLNLSISIQNIIFNLFYLYTIYWFISIFLFISKKNLYGKFTSTIQRFWKRSFFLFWSIEIFLFCIYLFLICNNPEETFYVLDFNKLNKTYLVNFYDFLYKSLFFVYISSVLYPFLLVCKVSKKKKFFFLFFWFHFLIYVEISQIIFINNYFFSYTYVYDSEDKIWSQENEALKSRTFFYYIFIIVLLKYWHIFFIYYYLILSYWYLSFTNFISFNWVSSLYQNFFYMYIFNFIYLYLFFKKFSKYYWSLEFNEMFLSQNVSNFNIYGVYYYFSFYYIFYLKF